MSFPVKPAELTKRGILANLAKVYDPLGLASPVTLEGKLVFRDACNLKIAWDAPLPNTISTQWMKCSAHYPSFPQLDAVWRPTKNQSMPYSYTPLAMPAVTE